MMFIVFVLNHKDNKLASGQQYNMINDHYIPLQKKKNQK